MPRVNQFNFVVVSVHLVSGLSLVTHFTITFYFCTCTTCDRTHNHVALWHTHTHTHLNFAWWQWHSIHFDISLSHDNVFALIRNSQTHHHNYYDIFQPQLLSYRFVCSSRYPVFDVRRKKASQNQIRYEKKSAVLMHNVRYDMWNCIVRIFDIFFVIVATVRNDWFK